MPSNQTANYQLSQWSKDDLVLMDDFNADNAKIDAAVKEVEQQVDGLSSGKADASTVTALTQTLNGKADASTVTALTQTVNGKADTSTVTALTQTVNSLTQTVNGKVDASTVTALTQTVNGKADASTVTALTQTVNGKAAASDLTALTQTVNSLAQTVNTKASTSALNTLTQTVSGKGNCQIATGTYTGNGATEKSLDFAGTLGRAPKLLLLRCAGALGQCLCIVAGMGATTTALDYNSYATDRLGVTWTATGVSWYCAGGSTNGGTAFNASGHTYYYVAFA